MVPFNSIWGRIEAAEGMTFRQKTGREFTYSVKSSAVVPSTTNQNIPKSHFEKAAELLPLDNTVPVQSLRGPSYIFAILMDSRIRRTDW